MDRSPPMTVPSAGRNRGFLEQIAEQLGSHASSSAVFGEPVERDGVTVVPVARVRYLFGGGSGEGPSGEGAGSGGGGAAMAEPVGYIRLANGKARWHAIIPPETMARAMVTAALGLGLGAFLVLRGIGSLDPA